jgi:hypothetical protein
MKIIKFVGEGNCRIVSDQIASYWKKKSILIVNIKPTEIFTHEFDAEEDCDRVLDEIDKIMLLSKETEGIFEIKLEQP